MISSINSIDLMENRCVCEHTIYSWTLHLNQFKQLSYGALERGVFIKEEKKHKDTEKKTI